MILESGVAHTLSRALRSQDGNDVVVEAFAENIYLVHRIKIKQYIEKISASSEKQKEQHIKRWSKIDTAFPVLSNELVKICANMISTISKLKEISNRKSYVKSPLSSTTCTMTLLAGEEAIFLYQK